MPPTVWTELLSIVWQGILNDPINFIWQGTIFMLPAAFANMAPVAAKRFNWFPSLAVPVWEWGLGPNKTYRGLVVGYMAAFLLVLLFSGLQLVGLLPGTYINYAGTSPFLLAFVFAGGALGGDMVKSLAKRKIAKIKAGGAWEPWDRVDFVLGTIVASLFCINWESDPPQLTRFGLTVLILALVVPLIQWVVNTIAYKTGFKETP